MRSALIRYTTPAILALVFSGGISSTHAQPGTLQFSSAVHTVSEAGPIAFTDPNLVNYLAPTLSVTRTGGSTGALTVDFCVWPDEMTSNALEYTYVGSGNATGNYASIDNTRRWVSAGKLTWADGDTAPKTLPFSFVILGNPPQYTLCAASAIQGTICYTARLFSVTGGATLGANAVSRLEILDAQGPTAGVLNFSARRFYGANGGSALISVRRDGGTTGSVSVNYATSSTLPAIGPNQQVITAGTAGTHYTTTSGTLTWVAGDGAVKTFTVQLPATSNTSGTMNVALNLSAPTNSAVLGSAPSALLTIQNKASIVYNINDNTDQSTYRVSLPTGPGPVRGVLFWWPGTAGDDRGFTTDPNFRKIADQWRFAIASPRGNYDSRPNRFEFPQPKLAFLVDRLAQIALTTGRPEIHHAPIVFSGMSAGSYSASSSLPIWPERTIAVVGQEGWLYPDPLPVTNNTFTAAAREVPALNIGGQNDATQSPPSQIFPAMNEFRKGGVTRSAMAMSWGRGHTFGNTGAAYNSFGLYWLDQVMAAGRYPAGRSPDATTAPVLGSLPIANGWWGVRNCTNTPAYELSGGSSRYLNIGPDASFTGIKDVNNALVDSWLPTESAARAYRAFVSLPSITFSTPAQFASGLVGQATSLAIDVSTFGSGLTKIEFYDGSTKIGEDATAPFNLSWAPTLAGARGLTAIASDSSGPRYSAFTLLLVTSPPTALAAFRTSYGLAGDGAQDLLTPAGDGVPNLLKFAFNMLGSGNGQAATLATPNVATLAIGGSAGLPLASADATGKLQLTYIRRKATASPAPGVTYSVEFSGNLATGAWAINNSATETIVSLDATFERVTVTDSLVSPTHRFARVRVTNL